MTIHTIPIIAAWAAITMAATEPARARQEQGAAPFVNTLVVPAPEVERPERIQTLLAPDVTPARIELPPTVIPPDYLAQTTRKRSDLNGDGTVDEQDLAMMVAAFGVCPDGAGACAADLNRDGHINETDLFLLRRHLGAEVGGSVEVHGERVGYLLPPPAGAEAFPIPPIQPRADGWRIVRMELHSPNAWGMRLQIAGLTMSTGLEVRVYDPAGTRVFGPYTNPRRGEDGTWWTPIIFGDAIGLEVALPPRREMPAPDGLPTIKGVMYLFCDGVQCHSAPGTALGCHNDITCNASWANNEGRAVAMIYFTSNGGCTRCSGALLNRGPGDFSPLFMTANHCIDTQAEANTVEVLWHYNTPTCNGTPPAYNTLAQSNGAVLLKRQPGADFCLLGLLEPPQTNVFLGWDADNWGPGDAATGVHHPRGTFKRISTGSSAGSTDGATFCSPGGPVPCTCSGMPGQCIAADVFNVSFTSGTTEPGSSGSPAFDSSRRVRGTLTGGPGGCATITAQYGRFDRAFVNLRYFLNDPDIPNGVTFVNIGFAGDPGNAGNTERGTAANPFNAVAEATFCVRSGQEVRITPGIYTDIFTIRRPMVLTRNGSSGTVRIGG